MRFLALLFLLMLGFTAFAQKIHFRYNHLGYTPAAPKKIILMSNEDIKGEQGAILNNNNDKVLAFELDSSIAGVGSHMPLPFNYVVDGSSIRDTGNYTLTLLDTTISFSVRENPYDFITSDILRYFRVQRSGTNKTLDTKVSHTGDRRCEIWTKKTSNNSSWELNSEIPPVDMLGGWYDAGDYIKFTLTTAYASYLMLRSYELNPELFNQQKYSKSDLVDVLDEAKWGLDYLMKCYPKDGVFVIQVGSADDHKQGLRLPNHDELDGKRQAYAALSPTQMGYTIAALALGAKTFEAIDPKLAEQYKTKAIELFNVAIDRTEISWVEEGWEVFYADNGYYDNMQLAAIELYRLTAEPSHLYWAKRFADQAKSAYWASWANCNLLAHTRLQDEYSAVKAHLKTDMDYFSGLANAENNTWGVPHKYTWATLYSFMGVANGASLLTFHGDSSYSSISYDMLDYTLGRNNWGIAMVASQQIPKSIQNVYSAVYKLKPKLYPTGAVAEGPGDRATHDRLNQYFKIAADNPYEQFNTSATVFYDDESDFQCMETTITGLGDALFFFTLMSTLAQ